MSDIPLPPNNTSATHARAAGRRSRSRNSTSSSGSSSGKKYNTLSGSNHFRSTKEIEQATSWRHFFSPNRKRSAIEVKFIRHAYFRSIIFLSACLYFVYCNPEFSHTYSYFRGWMGWTRDDPPLLPQIWKVERRSKD